jgi:uncharacterized PurR-regulated membrane protein YhhQ (DUF165 family)
MEKIKNISSIIKEKLDKSPLDGTTALVLLVAAISFLDLYSHPNSGLADLEKRKALESLIGNLTNHIGNFGISASFAIASVFIKNLFNEVFHSKIAKKIIKAGYTLSISSILTLNALIESFPENNEAIPDFLMGAFAVALAIPATQLAINKFKKKIKKT